MFKKIALIVSTSPAIICAMGNASTNKAQADAAIAASTTEQPALSKILDIVSHNQNIQDIITGYADHWYRVRTLPFSNYKKPKVNNLHFLPGIPVVCLLKADNDETIITACNVVDGGKKQIIAKSSSTIILGNMIAKHSGEHHGNGPEKGRVYYYKTCCKDLYIIDNLFMNAYAYSASKNLIAVAKHSYGGVIHLLSRSKEPHRDILKPILEDYIPKQAQALVTEFLGNTTKTILTDRKIPLFALAFSANGKYLASGDRAGWIRVHELLPDLKHTRLWKVDIRRFNPKPFDAQAELSKIEKHAGTIYVLAFYHDQLISASHNGTVQVWDSLTGKHLSTVAQFEYPVISLAISSDGQYLVAGLSNGAIELFANLGAQLRKYNQK